MATKTSQPTPAAVQATAAATIRPNPTNSPTSAPQGPATVAVINLRFDPADLHRNQQITFFVTFHNTFTTTQQRAWSIWVYQPDDLRKSFWHSHTQTSNIPSGDVELPVQPNDTWCVCGAGGAENFIARIQDDTAGASMPGLDGQTFWKSFTVNP